jgi:fumarate reductase subunit D
MKRMLLAIEPVVWVLFGLGIMLGTMLLTGWLLVMGLAVPLGLVDAPSYEHARALAAHPIGRLVLFALVTLPMWKGAHHTRHLSIDFIGVEQDAWMAPVLYLLAAFGSLLALVAVIRL